MRHRKLTAIRTETLEQWIVRRQRIADVMADCEQCGASEWLSITDACMTSRLTSAELCGLAEGGAIHSSHTSEGHLLICAASLWEFPETRIEDPNENLKTNK